MRGQRDRSFGRHQGARHANGVTDRWLFPLPLTVVVGRTQVDGVPQADEDGEGQGEQLAPQLP